MYTRFMLRCAVQTSGQHVTLCHHLRLACLCRLILSISAGTFFLLVFAIFRGKIQVFRTRLVSFALAADHTGPFQSVSIAAVQACTAAGLDMTLALTLAHKMQDLPSVWQKPPYLPVGGFNHLWYALVALGLAFAPTAVLQWPQQECTPSVPVICACQPYIRQA